ncbi:hypothetical protein K4K57_005485 [Colletotrichum sp. SAR 10_99]|nr:hypothetical protein K4K55_003498 [Colletotrichum sp. SAR 10_96]KAJ5018341.1 hypothetical protein K4K57_005485 [Colletotrichum sp. SAR 10_99]
MFPRKKKTPAREPPQAFGYNRDAVISLVKGHYRLLVDMGHLHPEALQAPPETGWTDEELNVDALRTLGRSDKVIDLLRHLPYPRAGAPSTDEAGDDAVVCYETKGDDYYLYDDAPAEAEEDAPWLSAKAVSFQIFFEKMHKDISSLKLVPAPAAGNFGAAIRAVNDPDAKAMKKLYREYGWPDTFRKYDFLRAAVPARAAILDDEYDWSDA